MTALAYLLLGVAAGLGWFGALRWVSVRLVATPSSSRGWMRLAIVQVSRMLLMAAVFVAAARQGALPLCMMAAGVVGAGFAWAAATRRTLRSGA